MRLKKIKISNLICENNVFLAPLAGYTNAVFRQMCRSFGAGLTFTEMVSAKGLCYNSEKTESLLFVTPEYDGLKACQLFGSEPEFMQRAVKSPAVAPFDIIDINMGCPMPKIYNNGEGSALMENFRLAEKIISAAKSGGKAVTVKFRIGLREDSIISAEFARMCEGAGADMITVHGRTRDKIYSGEVNFKAIAAAKNAVKIPVIANGGIFCAADADKLIQETGADGVAIARGAMYSPWIFSSVCGKQAPDKRQVVIKQLEDTQKYYGERFALVFMRKMCAFYIKGTPDCTAVREKLFRTQTVEELKEIIQTVF